MVKSTAPHNFPNPSFSSGESVGFAGMSIKFRMSGTSKMLFFQTLLDNRGRRGLCLDR